MCGQHNASELLKRVQLGSDMASDSEVDFLPQPAAAEASVSDADVNAEFLDAAGISDADVGGAKLLDVAGVSDAEGSVSDAD